MRGIKAKSLCLLFLALITACGYAQSPSTDKNSAIVNFAGTVTQVDLEGGFFGIVDDHGRHFDPVNLPADMQKDGLRVRGTARILENSIGIHMWGERIDIESIEIP